MSGTLDETTDIGTPDGDFLPHMPIVRGRVALCHRLIRRLSTPHGRFTFWPDFGLDLAKFLLAKATPSRIAQEAEAEVLKDEQVESCEVTVTDIDLENKQMELDVSITDAEGDFTFTMTISEAKASLISLQESS